MRDAKAQLNVGRSTFYKHFRDKEDVLISSLRPFLMQLSLACVSEIEPERLAFVPEHFWENRRFACVVFSGRSMALIVATLTEMIEHRLLEMPRTGLFSVRLVAAQIAAAQMTLLDEWLRGRGSATPLQVARALHRGSRALVRELLLGPSFEQAL